MTPAQKLPEPSAPVFEVFERTGKRRRARDCWYLRTIIECPVCMSHQEYVERQYTPRPESIADRIVYRSIYDGCQP